MTHKNNPSTRGFTLLEVLIAVLILGIIATVALPMLGSYTEKAREAREEANMLVKEQALDRYRMDHQAPPGFVYDAATNELVSYGPIDGQGAAAQMLIPTDANGNVLGDPVSATPGPFMYGPYLAQIPVEPAALLLGAKDGDTWPENRHQAFIAKGSPQIWFDVIGTGDAIGAASMHVGVFTASAPMATLLPKGRPLLQYFGNHVEIPLDPRTVTQILGGKATLPDLIYVIDALVDARTRLAPTVHLARDPIFGGLEATASAYKDLLPLEDSAREAAADSQRLRSAQGYCNVVSDFLKNLVFKEVELEKATAALTAQMSADDKLVFATLDPFWRKMDHYTNSIALLGQGKEGMRPLLFGPVRDGQLVSKDEPLKSNVVLVEELRKLYTQTEGDMLVSLQQSVRALERSGYLKSGSMTTAGSYTKAQFIEVAERFRSDKTAPLTIPFGEHQNTWAKFEAATHVISNETADVVKGTADLSMSRVTYPSLLQAARTGARVDREIENLGTQWGSDAAKLSGVLKTKYAGTDVEVVAAKNYDKWRRSFETTFGKDSRSAIFHPFVLSAHTHGSINIGIIRIPNARCEDVPILKGSQMCQSGGSYRRYVIPHLGPIPMRNPYHLLRFFERSFFIATWDTSAS